MVRAAIAFHQIARNLIQTVPILRKPTAKFAPECHEVRAVSFEDKCFRPRIGRRRRPRDFIRARERPNPLERRAAEKDFGELSIEAES